jgi:nucleoside-diphosphate-sugar epimerase
VNILLTGASGFIGKALLKKLLSSGHDVTCVGRSNPFSDKEIKKLSNEKERLTYIACDLIDDQQVLDLKKNPKVQTCQAIVHLAALYDLEESYANCYMSNVHGTQNLLRLAGQLKKLTCFHHISTVAVAGDLKGTIEESALKTLPLYDNAYAQTKMLSEQEVLKSKLISKSRIYRLGIVVGDSNKGRFDHVNGPYYFMQFLAKISKYPKPLNILPAIFLPYRPKTQFPLIAVDDVVATLATAIEVPTVEQQKIYHVVDGAAPNMQQFLRDSLNAFDLRMSIFPLPKTKLNAVILGGLNIPKELLTYIYAESIFDNKNLRQDYPKLKINSYAKYKNNLFIGAKKKFQHGVEL